MDEPLAALDKQLREHLQTEIHALQRRLAITTVYVTHDQAEAFAMSDVVAVMNAGRIEQVAAPRTLYDAPRTEFVARFVGDSNIFQGPVSGGRMHLEDGSALSFAPSSFKPRVLLVRPEKIQIEKVAQSIPADNTLRGHVREARFLGEACEYRVQAGPAQIVVRALNRASSLPLASGEDVVLIWAAADTVALP